MTYKKEIPLSNWQKQVIYGSILGGASVQKPVNGRNFYLSMRGKNLKWLEYKEDQISILKSQNSLLEKNGFYRWHSICSPSLDHFHDCFYNKNKRIIKMEVLNGLRDIGLMVWFLDSGNIDKKQVVMNTNLYGEGGTNTVSQYFSEIDLDNEIFKTRVGGYRIRLDEFSSSRFVKVIGTHLPPFMYGELFGML